MQNQEEMNSQDAISEDHSPGTFVQANVDEEQVGNLSHDDEEQEDEYDDADDIDDKDESDEEDNDTEDDDEDESTDSANEDDDIDPWDKLREEAVRDLNSVWEERVEELMMQGLPKEESNLHLPAYQKRLRTLYLHYLKWYCDLKTDPVHNKVTR